MSKIIGVTVGTPISPATIERKLKPVKTVNGIGADENGNVNIEVGGGGNVPTKVSEFENDAGYITEQALNGYAKTTDIPTDAHINDLINTALGVIENGSY